MLSMANRDLKYWVGFSLVPSLGPVRFGQLEKYFGSLENAWTASPGELNNSGIGSNPVESIIALRGKISLDAEIEKLERFGVSAFTVHDAAYPARLKEIHDPPAVLYVRGEILPADEWCVAVVGTRKATAYGRQVTEELVSDLARNRITVISGLAKGIDSIAHRSAIEAGGRTFAVFGCGLDTVYPAENTELAKRIIKQGALISEYPLGAGPRADHFPRRNRIISGLSLGVLVAEAGEDSGALITVRTALEQNREVFSVPGNILSPTSKGTNSIIKDGAKLVQSVTDILEELNLTAVVHQIEFKEVIPATDTETLILNKLSVEPVHIDEICQSTGLPASTVSSTLAMMELKGMVKQMGGMNYVIARQVREGIQ
jgi:DNA processing protein